MPSFRFPSLLFLFCLLSGVIQAAALTGRSPMLPGGVDPVCAPPRKSCGDACCSSNQICSADGESCVAKPSPPSPPTPGTFNITYYADRAGHKGLMYIHGYNFAKGAAVTISQVYIDYSYNPPAHAENTMWSTNFAGQSDFAYGTGWQDCSRGDVPGLGTYGETAIVKVFDWALDGGQGLMTYQIPVRVQWGQYCTHPHN